MKFFVCLFFLFVLLSSCSYQPYTVSEKQKFANYITAQVAATLKTKYSLIPCGSGGRMMGQIKMLALSFDYRQPLDIETGRKLLIHAINEYVSAVNADERIRPYLNNFPFTPNNIEIRIFLQHSDGSTFGNNQLIVISAIDGIFSYHMNDPNGPLFLTVLEETYEEAVEKVATTEEKSA